MSIKNCHTQHNEACVNAVRCIEAAERYIKKSIVTDVKQACQPDRGFLPVTFTTVTVFGLPACLTKRRHATKTHLQGSTHTYTHKHTFNLPHTHTQETDETLSGLLVWFLLQIACGQGS